MAALGGTRRRGFFRWPPRFFRFFGRFFDGKPKSLFPVGCRRLLDGMMTAREPPLLESGGLGRQLKDRPDPLDTTDGFDAGAETQTEFALETAHPPAYANQLEAFARSALHDEPTNPDVAEGLAVVRVLEAVEASLVRGARVEVIRD